MFAELLTERAAEPGDDLVSALVAEQGEGMTAAELAALVRLLLIAGFETTVNAIGNGMRWLLADREQWEPWSLIRPARPRWPRRCCDSTRRCSRPAGGPQPRSRSAVYRSPESVGDHAAGGRQPGSRRLPRTQPLSTSPGSPPAEHLAFSGGIHYCLGSPLARLELTQAFRGLAERFPTSGQAGPIDIGPVHLAWTTPASRSRSLHALTIIVAPRQRADRRRAGSRPSRSDRY